MGAVVQPDADDLARARDRRQQRHILDRRALLLDRPRPRAAGLPGAARRCCGPPRAPTRTPRPRCRARARREASRRAETGRTRWSPAARGGSVPSGAVLPDTGPRTVHPFSSAEHRVLGPRSSAEHGPLDHEARRRGRPEDSYGALVRSIVGQQLSVKAAATIYGRVTELYGGSTPTPRELIDNGPGRSARGGAVLPKGGLPARPGRADRGRRARPRVPAGSSPDEQVIGES